MVIYLVPYRAHHHIPARSRRHLLSCRTLIPWFHSLYRRTCWRGDAGPDLPELATWSACRPSPVLTAPSIAGSVSITAFHIKRSRATSWRTTFIQCAVLLYLRPPLRHYGQTASTRRLRTTLCCDADSLYRNATCSACACCRHTGIQHSDAR